MFFFGFGLCIAAQDEYTRYPKPERGQESNMSFDHAVFPCLIKLMKVFSVHSVQEHQQQQLDLPEARSRAAPETVTTEQLISNSGRFKRFAERDKKQAMIDIRGI